MENGKGPGLAGWLRGLLVHGIGQLVLPVHARVGDSAVRGGRSGVLFE
jgi:hypothetical protein